MARTIKANHLSVTGKVANPKFRVTGGVPFESTLERDLIIMAQFHRGVSQISSQPLTLEYRGKSGRLHTYTPDILVEYCPQPDPTWPKAVLYEVKYRKDLWRDWVSLKPKLKAARAYARERGWIFKIMTELEIRTPYLRNIMWLKGFINEHRLSPAVTMISKFLDEVEEADIETIITACSWEDRSRAEALGAVWAMLARGQLGTDLLMPLQMDTVVWLRRPEYERKWPA